MIAQGGGPRGAFLESPRPVIRRRDAGACLFLGRGAGALTCAWDLAAAGAQAVELALVVAQLGHLGAAPRRSARALLELELDPAPTLGELTRPALNPPRRPASLAAGTLAGLLGSVLGAIDRAVGHLSCLAGQAPPAPASAALEPGRPALELRQPVLGLAGAGLELAALALLGQHGQRALARRRELGPGAPRRPDRAPGCAARRVRGGARALSRGHPGDLGLALVDRAVALGLKRVAAEALGQLAVALLGFAPLALALVVQLALESFFEHGPTTRHGRRTHPFQHSTSASPPRFPAGDRSDVDLGPAVLPVGDLTIAPAPPLPGLASRSFPARRRAA